LVHPTTRALGKGRNRNRLAEPSYHAGQTPHQPSFTTPDLAFEAYSTDE
jgi:hypothetical protein